MLVSLKLPPGIYRNGTALQAEGRYYDANLVRWFSGEMRPMGGWQKHSAAAAMAGAGRAIIAWRQNNGSRWIAVGTSSGLYVISEAGTLADITPLRRTQTLGTNPIVTTNTSTTITVTDTAHGASPSQIVTLSGATATGGLTTGQLDATFTIVTTTTNTWTAVVSGSGATSGATGGGSAVVAKYRMAAGTVDAVANIGYGAGPYGSYTYGTPRPDTGTRSPATVWTLDTWGEDLVACSDTDGKIYQWTLDPATPAALLTNAPTGNASIVVTPERTLMALGASGNPRLVQNSDQEDNTDWTTSDVNQARQFQLQTFGTLMCGRAMKGMTLLLTTTDAWTATYVNYPLVYGYARVGQGCGAISKQALVVTDTSAAWMGVSGFYAFDGQVSPLACDVQDYVFSDLNTAQQSKISAVHLAAFNEVMWCYPSSSSLENDRYVLWNYVENHWNIGMLSRLSAVDKGVFETPLMVSADGYVYEHETGFTYDSMIPYAETGPFELNMGNNVCAAVQMVGDEKTAGDVQATVYGRFWPQDTETTFGPYAFTSSPPTDVRFTARQIRFRFTGVRLTDWRVGNVRLEVRQGGQR